MYVCMYVCIYIYIYTHTYGYYIVIGPHRRGLPRRGQDPEEPGGPEDGHALAGITFTWPKCICLPEDGHIT